MIRGGSSTAPTASGSSRERRSPRGQSLVEFAIFLPVLVTVLLIAVDVGRVYLGWITLSNIARIGANFAAMNPQGWQGSGDPGVQARYRALMLKDANGIDCTLPSTLPNPSFPDSYDLGDRAQVDLSCSFPLVTPFLSGVIGDGAGNINVGASAVFAIRSGSVSGVALGGSAATAAPTPTAEPTQVVVPTPTPTATPTPDPGTTPDPGATPSPTPSATPTSEPILLSFYGTSTSTDASGGGPPGSVDEQQIVGVSPLAVTFYNTSTGPPRSSCDWVFGDGNTTSSCGNTVTHTYTSRGTFSVTLTVDGVQLTRTDYVLVGCKVPAFAGVRKNNASSVWTSAGFSASNLSALDGSGNYKIGYQSLVGGLVNPVGGCSGAEIVVGP